MKRYGDMIRGRAVCTKCHREYPLSTKKWRCECTGLLDLELQSRFPTDRIAHRKPTMWRYREALPIEDDDAIVSFDEGFTPLVPVQFDRRTVLVKQDYLFPTGSYKDRGASVLVSKARELGVHQVVEDSSGNAGAAIAGYCARAGIGCEVLVPYDTAPSKLSQITCFGAVLRMVKGSREDTARAALVKAKEYYYASHVWNPFFFHGTKTFAFEVCEQLDWRAPDTVVLPVGNGTLLVGAYIGFAELLASGIIHKIPRIVGIQAMACAPLVMAFETQSHHIPTITRGETVAEGIAIAEPVRGYQVLSAVHASNGLLIAVGEEEIKAAFFDMCAQGFFIEPTAAATIAGVKKYLQRADAGETIVSTMTGSGLKNIEKVSRLSS